MSRIAITAALAALSSAALAQAPTQPTTNSGYVQSSSGQFARGAFGQCVRTGYWNAALAADPCDATARAGLQPAAVARPEPVPQAQPAPIVAAVPRPVLEKVTLSSDVLFEFNKAQLRPEGREKLDELAGRIRDANVEEVVAVGYADRIASENYNQKLSEERANAVKVYLVDKGLKPEVVKTEGKGESQPVTGDDCKKMGPERASNKKLVECLQPDRRVEIEVFGTREVAGTATGGAGTGASGSGAGGSGTGGSGSSGGN